MTGGDGLQQLVLDGCRETATPAEPIWSEVLRLGVSGGVSNEAVCVMSLFIERATPRQHLSVQLQIASNSWSGITVQLRRSAL